MNRSSKSISTHGKTDIVKNTHPLNLIVGDYRVSPCDHQTFDGFKLWVAKSIAQREIETYSRDNVVIEHWSGRSESRYAHLLNPCECGTYLPMEIEPTPMFSSAIGLLSDLNHLKEFSEDMPASYRAIVATMMQMAELSLDTNTALEIK